MIPAKRLSAITLCILAQQTMAQTDSAALAPVVVTAQKRSQSAQEVPISMTVVDAQALEKTHALGLEDMQQLVPNLSLENQGGFNVLTVRGVGGGGRNMGFDPRVGVYVDGIYMGQAQALTLPLFDVEQVEVLRGPQGFLFGRNTVAGAVNISTAAPAKTLDGYVRGVVGNQGIREVYASLSGPLSATAQGKIGVASQQRDGWTRNQFDGSKLDDMKRLSARGQLAVALTPRLKLTLAADSAETEQKLLNGEPVSGMGGAPLASPAQAHTVSFNTRPLEKVKLSGASVTASYQLDNGDALTAVLGQRNTHQAKTSDNDYGPADLLWTHYVDDFRQGSQELRLASPNRGTVRYVAGLYHLNETARTDRVATVGNDWFAPGATVWNNGRLKTDTTALYGALDIEVAPKLTLNLGGRYTHETKDIVFNLGGPIAPVFGLGNLDNFTDKRTENQSSPSLGVSYAISSQQNVYAKLARGFKSGGWNAEYIDPVAAKHPGFDSESVTSLELGTKGQFNGGRGRYELALFSSRFTNFQVLQFVDLGGGATSILLKNAARVQSEGADASVAVRVTPELELGVNLGLNHATFKQFAGCAPTVDCSGHDLPYAPRNSAALTANYRMPLASLGGRLDIYGEYSLHGAAYSDPVNDAATQRLPARNMTNLRLAFVPNDARWDASLWVRNLTNNESINLRARDFLGHFIVRRMEPRTVGLELKYSLD